MENDGKLTKREYTLLLEHNMSNISKMQWCMPLISSDPKADSTVADNKLLFGRKWYRTHWDTLQTHGVYLASYYKMTRDLPTEAKDEIWLAGQLWCTSSSHGWSAISFSFTIFHRCPCYSALFCIALLRHVFNTFLIWTNTGVQFDHWWWMSIKGKPCAKHGSRLVYYTSFRAIMMPILKFNSIELIYN